MSDAATASAAQAVVSDAKTSKSPKKRATTKSAAGAKKHADHPKYSEMINAALTSLKERGGSSRQAVLKYIMKAYNVGKDENVVNTHLKMALRAGVKNASLKQSKGSGASGSFRLGEEAKKKPKATKAKKPKSPAKVKKPKAKTASAGGAKSPKKMAKKATTKSAAPKKATKAAKPTTAAAAVKKSKADKPKKAAAAPKKAKADKPKKSPVKKAKPAATKKAPAKAKKPVAAKKA